MGEIFMNPVLMGFNPDPSVARNGDDFFLATSSFEMEKGCRRCKWAVLSGHL
jgi:beta-xylosidase